MKRDGYEEYSQIKRWVLSNYGHTSVEEWVEKAVQDLLGKSNQYALPIQLEPIFKSRKIERVEVQYLEKDELAKKGIGELKIKDFGFVLTINRVKNNKFQEGNKDPFANKRERFTIAHEIAHTFFYDVSANPPRRSLSPQNDNSDEALCNRLAAAILLPKEKVVKIVENYLEFLQCDFKINKFLELCMKMSKIFNVSLNVVLRRLIEDMNLLDMLVLSCFWGSKDNNNISRRAGEEAWRLRWYAKPTWASKELFIPTKGFPRIHLDIVDKLYKSYGKINHLACREKSNKLKLGNLTNFIKKSWGVQNDYPVYAALIKGPRDDLSLFPRTYRDDEEVERLNRIQTEIIVCIPLRPFKN